MWKYNNSWFENGWYSTEVLDTTNNIVGVNITDYGSIFAPLEMGIFCGNGIIEAGESCDLTNLSGQTCITQGFAGGTLSCTLSCVFDTSACTSGGGGGGDGDCTPDCEGKECGDDGCGGSCGECDEEYECEEGLCVLICEEDWECGEWGECIDGIQNRTCNDLNECGTELNKPVESQTCEVICEEDWVCSWTQCSEGDEFSYAYDCVDLNDCGTEGEKPTQKACILEEQEELREQEKTRTGCDSIWVCGDWGTCDADYDVEEVLLENIAPTGVQKRECIDETGCANPKIEKRPCSVAVPVETKVTEWCFEEYVEVYEKSSKKLVSRVKKEKLGFTELKSIDISFITGEFTGYCDYCYNGIQDYDEEGVDCGGASCPECIEEETFFDWLFWLLVFLWGAIFIGTFVRLWADREVILLHVRDMNRQKDIPYSKGVEETIKGQKSFIGILPKPIREKGPKVGLFDVIVRNLSGKPYFGKKVTEAGISQTKPTLRGKSYSEKEIKSYKERQSKPSKPIIKRIKEFFIKPKVEKITKEPSSRGIAKSLISETKKELGKKGF